MHLQDLVPTLRSLAANNVDRGLGETEIAQPEIDRLRGPEAVPVRDENHDPIAHAMRARRAEQPEQLFIVQRNRWLPAAIDFLPRRLRGRLKPKGIVRR